MKIVYCIARVVLLSHVPRRCRAATMTMTSSSGSSSIAGRGRCSWGQCKIQHTTLLYVGPVISLASHKVTMLTSITKH
ncbi:hypothetical protein PR003_g31332 [Phytophthora rubi]|uniref:Uncharacterized protein n=1 Tax=Phytophthora rubi TaxID=129364 RepID=A0A6A4B6E2_9STRA|nr:hypothetical protein PR001_g33854 [Phytophthora rubi]KAE8960931.1 hypothetical protein PR002_g30059 [Phytophthora rubi]KAE9268778.1 hypothetical protein PR003_g31332 [Phytophthora rubi]